MMAAARKQGRRKSRGSSGGLPGWAMLLIGLVIGLFVAFLVYLDDLDPREDDDIAIDADDDVADTAAEDRPRFEFYSILPELEVVIPEFPRRDRDEAAEEDIEADIAPPSEGVDPLPTADPDGRFFLQVGSFQEQAQAESMKAQVALLGLDVQVRSVQVNGDDWHRVRVGPFSDNASLESAQSRLRDNGIDYLVLRDRS
jgi:cell division septation protein DedD